MESQAHIDAEALIREATRYLAAVDAFRAERCEPTWRPDVIPCDVLRDTSRVSPRSGPQPQRTRRQ
jgi:hypothetical protein